MRYMFNLIRNDLPIFEDLRLHYSSTPTNTSLRWRFVCNHFNNMASSSSNQSRYIHINSTYFPVMTVYESRMYVHLRNKTDKKKRMSMSYDDAFKVVLSSFERFENAARDLRDEEVESRYLHINSTYYAIMNRYESRVYVHLRNKYDKKKRMSMSYNDAFRVMLGNAERFMKAARSLEGGSDDDDDEEEDEDEDDDDDDVDRAFKQCASITGDELTAKKSKTTEPKRSRKRKHKDK